MDSHDSIPRMSKFNEPTTSENKEDCIEAISNQVYDQDVKSTAIVKYSAVNSPARFCKLQSNTDLNLPPDNWLREDKCRILQGVWNSYTNHLAFSSLYMANDFPDCLGEVDVVSNAENIKKLLKIPYSKSSISMMVHRVGKTILIDEFDIQRHLLQTAKKEWEWLKNFYFENVIDKLRNDRSFRKNRKRDHLQNKSMLSKFLYYSVAEPTDGRRESDAGSPKKSSDPRPTSPQPLDENDSVPFPEEEQTVFDHDHSFQRNIVWNFEDIRMLLGTDMPIFGGGTHPCVSLRLREITKPINILCGLDYWLDNLMCNVPEVMMCYHLEGIVQKYELIKTEDIPKLDNSKFSPNVVKYIAQNILSFLKSNVTKAGHTYWLIKAKDDDVVKLYDLTTLCADALDDKEQNPFAVPVAMLLYRVARNMKSQGTTKSQTTKICSLLENCLSLLDARKHPQVVTSAHFLLSDFNVPSTINLSNPLTINETSDNEDESDAVPSEQPDTETITSCSLEVKALCSPDKMSGSAEITPISSSLSSILEDRCKIALNHAEQGLSCIELSYEEFVDHKNKLSSTREMETMNEANPNQAIPLPFNDTNCDSTNATLNKNDMHLKCKDLPLYLSGSWQGIYSTLLLQKACISSYAMASWLSTIQEVGTAFRYLELSFLTYDAVEFICSKISGVNNQELQSLPCYMLGLAGDLNFILVQNQGKIDIYKEQYNNFNNWEGIRTCATKILKGCNCFQWAVEIHQKLLDALINSHKCYELALRKDGPKEAKQTIQKRLGNIKNELGVYYMSQASNVYNEIGEITEDVHRLWKSSYTYLKAGVKIFQEIQNDANIALLCCNTARLFRLQACCYGSLTSGNREFTTKEKQLYEKAIEFYQIALRGLNSDKELSNIKDSISWDLCTTYFTMATLLQDYPPISEGSFHKTEKEITELMLKSLKLCEVEVRSSKQPIYQFRAAVIQRRLGSLHHHAYRRIEESKQKHQRTLTEMYLSKAAELFKVLEDASEYFLVQLERIGLWKSHFESLSSIGAKEKCLNLLLGIILDVIPMMSILCDIEGKVPLEDSSLDCESLDSTSSEDIKGEDQKEMPWKYLKLLQEQLQLVLLNSARLYSKPNAVLKKEESQKCRIYKSMYTESLRHPSSGVSYSPSHFISILSNIKQLYHDI